MKPVTHYCSGIVDDITRHVALQGWRGVPAEKRQPVLFMLLVKAATKFAIGPQEVSAPTEDSEHPLLSYCGEEHLSLPYDVMAFEQTVRYPDGDVPTVVLLWDTRLDHPVASQHREAIGYPSEAMGIGCAVWQRLDGRWYLHKVVAGILLQRVTPDKSAWVVPPKGSDDLVISTLPMSDDIPAEKTAMEFAVDWLQEVAPLVRPIMRTLWRLSQPKKTVEVIAASKKLNKKRVQRGNEPFYDYRVVTIDPEEERRVLKDRLRGTHASPKLHVRRGHWRRYKSGRKVWVDQMLVGNPERGMVLKDYEIKGEVPSAAGNDQAN